jgi:hypothetical protein
MNPFLFKTPPIDLFNADQSYNALHRIYRRTEQNMPYYMEKADGKRAATWERECLALDPAPMINSFN